MNVKFLHCFYKRSICNIYNYNWFLLVEKISCSLTWCGLALFWIQIGLYQNWIFNLSWVDAATLSEPGKVLWIFDSWLPDTGYDLTHFHPAFAKLLFLSSAIEDASYPYTTNLGESCEIIKSLLNGMPRPGIKSMGKQSSFLSSQSLSKVGLWRSGSPVVRCALLRFSMPDCV